MDTVSIVLIWILFPDLDPYLGTETVLGKMASKVGKPLFADQNTTYKDKLTFARVMVEMDVAKPRVEHVTLNTPFRTTKQRIEYEWIPFYCNCCGKLGHQSDTCKKNRNRKPIAVVPSITKEVPQPEIEQVMQSSQAVNQISGVADQKEDDTSDGENEGESTLVKGKAKTRKISGAEEGIKNDRIEAENTFVVLKHTDHPDKEHEEPSEEAGSQISVGAFGSTDTV